ncbi:hypothetical protein GOBAR_DD08800 [Gossypium barbadense]|nr:hypothetical protein GOBAR_DD08800 [Gossypium barbadense]
MEKGFLNKVEDNATELKEIWDQWNNEVKQLFYENYGDLPYFLDVKFKVSSGQDLLESSKCANLFKEVDGYNRDE